MESRLKEYLRRGTTLGLLLLAGTPAFAELYNEGGATATGDVTAANVNTANVTASGQISANGNVSAQGDVKAKGNLVVEDGGIKSKTDTALTLSGKDAEVKGNLTVVGNLNCKSIIGSPIENALPALSLINNNNNNTTYGVLRVDYQHGMNVGEYWPGCQRTLLKAQPNKSVGMVNTFDFSSDPEPPLSDYGAMHGVLVSPNGTVGIGNADEFSNWAPISSLQICNDRGTTLNGSVIGFNTYWKPEVGYTYVGYPKTAVRERAGACFLQADVWHGEGDLTIGVLPVGDEGTSPTYYNSIKLNNKGTLFVGQSWGTARVDNGQRSPVALNVNGIVQFKNVESDLGTSPLTSGAALYCKNNVLWALENGGYGARITSHKDPRDIDPQAKTSFDDPMVSLPYSFQHENIYTGQGQVVDMAKLVHYVEKKMKAEMGERDGKLVYNYKLPDEQIATVEKREIESVLDELSQMPNIEVRVGKNGKIPDEAFEVVNEVIAKPKTVEIEEKQVDFESGCVVSVKRKEQKIEYVPTGRKTRRFKAGWSFKDGRLYRQPTVNDVDVIKVLRKHPQLPRWVQEHMHNGGNKKVSLMVDDIKEKVQAMAVAGSPQVSASSNVTVAGR